MIPARRRRQDIAERIGDGDTAHEYAHQIHDPRPHHRRYRLQGMGIDDRGNGVRRITKPIARLERQDHDETHDEHRDDDG
ncbi:hypothetical protein C0Z18_05305 [Trinickia dabaoshanensis]|uniref:Uncharacterized protein n=1 Tax=Trinickia dabaoshanensis TaxID=564714 RepID=A0A2N7VXS2_9BURK|nr:hypothetical protein C0Z18_05305 [Trinickia dabaoshanensis]